ncbi:arf-GAP with Rho-GAP domain, ANK repeat and PH domain-containing protein 1 [Mastacembelus armatus]|uniref:arf-GAP with Rho-GAP domain, ANK repeat and PH domain-containing protein 1 n=1 Tax=Mastacembelus armatus TaxID=205130 RepID=UPI000E45C397|nr:arf-GAP with Rho-GAP domain, ANK repeat and PH domain-containing protein 1-like [Mastacembelus armatus]XP_026166082.1 arf-GAP with Rho-GAP domain, ANK repeat and PH domain-containing protein 1-like [Mastacembelus armatus]
MPPPVPKPRARYMRDNLSSTSNLDRDVTDETPQQPVSSNGVHLSTDAPPLPPSTGATFLTLAGVADIIATNIPSLAGVTTAIKGSAPTPSAPCAPLSIDSMANSIAAHIPSLAGAASTVANPAAATINPAPTPSPVPATNTGSAKLDSIVSSLANISSLAGIVNSVANTAVSPTPSATPPLPGKPSPPSLARLEDSDVGALSQLVMSTLDPTAGVTLPPVDGTESTNEGLNLHPGRKENPYVTVLACWTSQEGNDTDSSNEEEDTRVKPNGPVEGDPAPNQPTNTNSVSPNPSGRIIPARPAPPPPRPAGQSGKSMKQKIPRAATIRVSRKKGGSRSSAPQSAVVQSSWLDVWKGFRHNVLWVTLDGQLMSLWKKRTDRFSEVLFHVSSITNVKKQDKRRFSVYFRKKHYDFMAHSDEVQDAWVTSLLASRGQTSPPPPELHGQITIKDTRSRAYAAVWGHNLWIYPNKEGFQLGVASFSVPLNLAMVKPAGKHSFTLITPYKSFNLSVDSSKDLSIWLDSLSSSILSALSCSQVALRLWENPSNKVCGDCGSANPEWASVNLLLVICQSCAGQHRALGSKLSKVRSLKMDSKIWTEPLIQLLVTYGNWLANQVWAPVVPAAEQLLPDSPDEVRSQFIQDKYSRGCYRRVHPLTSSRPLMDQRLREVVCSDDVEETMSLICSGAKVCQSDPQSPSPILLAERAGQGLQTELLRLNEFTEVPPYLPQAAQRRLGSATSGEEEEELHGKLEEDRFLFSLENDSAACDVLDLREVLSVFLKDGPTYQFEMVTLSDQLMCAADDREKLLNHLVYILKVILPKGVTYAEVGGASAVSKVCMVEVGGASKQSDAWLLLWEDGVSIHPVHRHSQQVLRMELSTLRYHDMDPSENTITMVTGDRSVSLRFEEQHSCESWFKHLQRALSNHSSAPRCPTNQSSTPQFPTNKGSDHQPLYPVIGVESRGLVPVAIERCISHVTAHGLQVEGVYRRCGLTTKVNRLVEALMTSPGSASLESDEQGVLDAGAALKQYVRQQKSLIPDTQQWLQAAVISDERSRFKAYRQLLRQLPDDNRATLGALFGHFYMVQVYSQVNKMSAHNLAVVLLPSLFQTMSQDLLRLTREFIIHHMLLFLTPEAEEEVQVTVF